MTGPAAAETRRVDSLNALGLLDTPSEERFDRVARLAATLLGTPMALVSLVGVDRQWFKACVGVDFRETPRSMSFCAHALHLPEALVVEDAAADPRFADNPLVTGPMQVRFYAGHPIRAANGQPLGTLCVLDTRPRGLDREQRDVLRDLAAVAELEVNAGELSMALAARRESEERLRAEQREMARLQEEFLRAAAHELRTPLTNLRGYADSLLDPSADELTGEQELAVAAIARNAIRMEDLVEDMLLVLRLEAGEIALEPGDVDLAAIVSAVAAGIADRAAAAGVTLAAEAGAPVTVRGDRRLLERVTARLVASGVAATPAGGHVEVLATEEEGRAVLSVRDGGAPLDRQEAERALKPFYRASVSATAGATGFALSIARGVAAVHGGALELTPTGGGNGVRVILPRP